MVSKSAITAFGACLAALIVYDKFVRSALA